MWGGVGCREAARCFPKAAARRTCEGPRLGGEPSPGGGGDRHPRPTKTKGWQGHLRARESARKCWRRRAPTAKGFNWDTSEGRGSRRSLCPDGAATAELALCPVCRTLSPG